MSEEFYARVTSWHTQDHRGRPRRGSGFVRLIGENDSTTNQVSLFLKEENIVTEGAKTLKPGSLVSCQIGEIDAGFTTASALNVSIYSEDSNSNPALPVEIEPSAQEK